MNPESKKYEFRNKKSVLNERIVRASSITILRFDFEFIAV